MKFCAALLFATLLTFSASAQKKAPKGYVNAPALSITGDFDGDGKQDILNQFIADSLGNRLDHLIEIDNWDTDAVKWDREDYNTAFTLNGKPANIANHVAVGLYCLINLGDINSTKGDEIALVSLLLDYTVGNTCHIYSCCKGEWSEVFNFHISENAFSRFKGQPDVPFTSIPGYLEKRNGKWVYMDYMEWLNADAPPTMKTLKAGNCKQ